jgi:DNA-binding NarL/FixJ family response regulator
VASENLRSSHPEIGVLVLSQYLDARYAMRLLEQHPERVGYLLKERVSEIGVLTDALLRIRDGESVVDPKMVARLVKRRRNGPLLELTERERRCWR